MSEKDKGQGTATNHLRTFGCTFNCMYSDPANRGEKAEEEAVMYVLSFIQPALSSWYFPRSKQQSHSHNHAVQQSGDGKVEHHILSLHGDKT